LTDCAPILTPHRGAGYSGQAELRHATVPFWF
jgi:hypothetical protein